MVVVWGGVWGPEYGVGEIVVNVEHWKTYLEQNPRAPANRPEQKNRSTTKNTRFFFSPVVGLSWAVLYFDSVGNNNLVGAFVSFLMMI